MIRIQQLSKSYKTGKGTWINAVEDLSFTCEPAMITGLLGPNGAGKTTTLRTLATLIRPSSGVISIAGLDVSRNPHEVRHKIGFLSGLTRLYGRLNAGELMDYFSSFYKLDRNKLEQQKRYLFDTLDINDYKLRPIDTLSTGQRQRINIARTLVHDPDVIILDEPTLGLDLFAKKSIFDVMRLCREQGKTILFSTHDIFEIRDLCDHLSILHEGRLLYDGTVTNVLADTETERLDDAFLKLVGRQTKV
ncbi:MAG: ATP-binding cassette domain-containing protein [Thiotrichales bacterium]|nr:ATP-binding cassette domain-containing protein [Thiotrichales bacterium]